MSCQSAAKVAADIFVESEDVASSLGCAIVVGLGAAFGVPIDYATCFEGAKKTLQYTGKMVAFWNKAASNGWAAIGPRILEPNTTYKGTLVGTTGRMFITPWPLPVDEAELIITETNGKAKTNAIVCSYNQSGDHMDLAEKWFNDTKERKNKSDEQRSIILRGVRNKILSVKLDAKSFSNKFSYTVRLNT